MKFKDVPVASSAFLLDVSAIPAISQGIGGQLAAGSQYQAVLRDVDGRIVVRVPDMERADPEYQRVAASALKGEEAVKKFIALANERGGKDNITAILVELD